MQWNAVEKGFWVCGFVGLFVVVVVIIVIIFFFLTFVDLHFLICKIRLTISKIPFGKAGK